MRKAGEREEASSLPGSDLATVNSLGRARLLKEAEDQDTPVVFLQHRNRLESEFQAGKSPAKPSELTTALD